MGKLGKLVLTASTQAQDRKRNNVEIVKWYGGDAARQRAERDALRLFNSEVLTVDEVTWPEKPASVLVPGTTIRVSHVLVLMA